ncbi:MAG: hypothetical protein ABL907_25355 [Hyphomicrobium sp.]
MTRAHLGALALACLATAASITTADARCTINAPGIGITPVTANTGTIVPPTAPTAQAVNFTVSGTYTTNGTAGTCRVAISFNRASLPASMARSGGGATLPYTIRSLAGGGNTLLYTGGGIPAAANRLLVTFASAGPNLTNRAFSVNMTAYFLAQPGTPQREGSYTDGPTVHIFNVRGGGAATDLGSRAFTVNGTVSKSCTIGGVINPADSTATIPVSTAGVVTTTAIVRSFVSVVCNSLTNVGAESQSGAVARSGAPPSGFTNLINYSASATFSGATSTLNTATIATATAPESGTIATTASATPSGTLSVTITPQAAASRLMSGSYADTLRIRLTAQ